MFLAIDYGKKRLGLAIGSVLPRGCGVIDGEQALIKIVDQIKDICTKEEVEAIILGWPFRSQGEEGTIAAEIKNFGNKLHEATGLPIIYEPEQFTSVAAEAALKEHGGKDFDKSKIDEISAILLLEQYLNHK